MLAQGRPFQSLATASRVSRPPRIASAALPGARRPLRCAASSAASDDAAAAAAGPSSSGQQQQHGSSSGQQQQQQPFQQRAWRTGIVGASLGSWAFVLPSLGGPSGPGGPGNTGSGGGGGGGGGGSDPSSSGQQPLYDLAEEEGDKKKRKSKKKKQQAAEDDGEDVFTDPDEAEPEAPQVRPRSLLFGGRRGDRPYLPCTPARTARGMRVLPRMLVARGGRDGAAGSAAALTAWLRRPPLLLGACSKPSPPPRSKPAPGRMLPLPSRMSWSPARQSS